MVYNAIRNLVEYGLETGLITENDRTYAINQLLERCVWMNMRSRLKQKLHLRKAAPGIWKQF